MWLLEFLFLLVTFILGWTLFGYLLTIRLIGLFRKKSECKIPETFPVLSIIVPCFNEEDQIVSKIEDLQKLNYPWESLEIVIVDGGSTDRSVELATEAIKNHRKFKLLVCPTKGKINQLNFVLPQIKSEIIVNSDVDSRLEPDSMKWIAAEFAASPEVWVVGAYCRPLDSIDIEICYWASQNKGRFMESDAGSSSIVIAQCYAFRRELLKCFPDDVVADDVYVAFAANTLGKRVVYSRIAKAFETRNPQDYSAFIPHKFRKSNAFLRESLRFLYRLPEMNAYFKVMFLTKLGQQLLLPWTFFAWFLVAGSLLTFSQFDIVFFGMMLLMVLFVSTAKVFSWVKLPDQLLDFPLATLVRGYFLTMMVLLATGISYPFFCQGSSYSRLENKHSSS